MGVDLRHQTAEMIADAVGVQRRLIGPFLDEDEVAGLALIRKQIIGNAQGSCRVRRTNSR